MPLSSSWRILVVAGAVLAALAAAQRGMASERAREFLDGLRERGLYDCALLYLDQASSSRLVPDDFKESLLYERGVTLLDLALQTVDPGIREKRLQEAEGQLEAFVQAHSSHALVPAAQSQLSDVLLQHGRALVARSQRPAQKVNRDALLAKARGLFQQVRVKSEENETYYTGALKELPKVLDPKRESSKIQQRDQLRGELLNAKLMAAAALREEAKTFPRDSKPYETQLGDAAKRYGDMYEKYRRRLAGMYARLWEGQCYQDLGQPEKALGCCQDLMTIQPAEQPAVRALIAKAVKLYGDCLLEQKKYDQVIEAGREWLDTARGDDSADSNWLAVKYQVASAHVRQAEAIRGQDAARRRHLKEARALARAVIRHRSPYQKQARALLAETGAAASSGGEPATFATALQAAQEALDLMKTAKLGMELARKNNPDSAAQLAQQFEENRDGAVNYLRLALRLADSETPVADRNQARYYLCYLNWELGRYYDAAVLGQFLARTYPNSAGARQGARIAMASYQKLCSQPGSSSSEFETGKLVEIAELIAKRWSGQADADDAYAVLAGFAVLRDQWPQALEYLDKISPDRRARTQLKVGLALWGRFLQSSRSATEDRPAPTKLDELKAQAQATLERGIDQLKGGNDVSETLATATLSLAQIHLDSAQYDKAVTVLEDKQVGPLTLLQAGHQAAARAGFAEEAYKAALRAYVSAQPPLVEKAQRIMDLMELSVSAGEDTQAAEKLTRIYVGLGHQLAQQLERLGKAGNQEERARVARAFESLLNRASQRETAGDWASQNWIAQTYASLGAGLHQGTKLSPEATAYYQKAVAAYDAILKQAGKEPTFAPSAGAVQGVMMRQAECLRKLRKFSSAISLYAALLARKPNMLDAQVTAAYAYQERGRLENSQWYPYAWKGGRKDKKTGKNRIWGWARIARVTARYAQYREVFHESRYNLALCRYRYALEQTDDKQQQKYLRMANSDIRYTAELYPDLGGETWRPQYDRLLKNIQRHMDEDPVGLKQFGKTGKANKKETAGK